MADGTEAKLQIYSVEEAEATAAVCVVRCVGGLVRTGQRFRVGPMPDSAGPASEVTLDRINRYERPTDRVGPPHTAKVHLSGEAVAALERGVILTSTATA